MDTIYSKAVAETNMKPLFDCGIVNCMPEAGELLGRTETNIEATNKIIADMIGRHITCDFGLAPNEVVAQNIHNIVAHPTTLKVMSVFSLDKTQTEKRSVEGEFHEGDIHVLTEVHDGQPVTFLLSAKELMAHLTMARIMDTVSRAFGGGVKLEGTAPAGNA